MNAYWLIVVDSNRFPILTLMHKVNSQQTNNKSKQSSPRRFGANLCLFLDNFGHDRGGTVAEAAKLPSGRGSRGAVEKRSGVTAGW